MRRRGPRHILLCSCCGHWQRTRLLCPRCSTCRRRHWQVNAAPELTPHGLAQERLA